MGEVLRGIWEVWGHISDGMGQGVASEVAVPTEHLTAGAALVRLVVRVGEEVRLEIRPLVE